MIFTPQLQEFVLKEKMFYEDIEKRISEQFQTDNTYSIQQIYQIFSHLSLMQNTQSRLLTQLMKMMGSLAHECHVKDFQNPVPQNQQSKNNIQQEDRDKKDFFKKQFQKYSKKKLSKRKFDNPQPLKQEAINRSQSKSKQQLIKFFEPILTQDPEPRLFRENVRTKQDRQQMNGQFCADCQKFAKELELGDQEMKTWKDQCTRHRTNERNIQERLLMTPE